MPARQMVLCFAWPLCIGALGLAIAWCGSWSPLMQMRSTGLTLFTLSSVALIVNTPVQAARLAIHHAPPGRRVGNPLGHLRGRDAVLVALAVLIPFLLVLVGVLLPVGAAIFRFVRS